jgi:hypothetical protein
MLWYDTGNNILKMRTEADDAWINVGYLDQSTNAFRILDDTQVVNTSGTQTGLLGDQATSAWEAGTSTTESLVSPAKVKAAIDALAPVPDTGGMALLATLDTSSGASVSATGLDLSNYVMLKIVFVGVSCSQSNRDLRVNTSNKLVESGDSVSGFARIDGSVDTLLLGSLGVTKVKYASDGAELIERFIKTDITDTTTTLTFDWDFGDFDRGEIKIYGVK